MTADVLPVRASGLEALFGNGDGVGPVDLRVGPGESVLVLGPSGSGKSTLLHCLTGAVPHAFDADTSGAVEVCGVLVAGSSVADLSRHVGVVAQDPETGVCLPHVADELAFPLENRATEPGAIDAAVSAALATAGAGALRDRRTTELSGGELQRVALAAAIVTAPAVLVLDEPTSMLDAAGVAAVRAAVDAARQASGSAVVLVEHRLDEYAGDDGVAGLPGRAVVLDRNGRVVADGPSLEVFDHAGGDLLRHGCWLPLDAELNALFGLGGLEVAGVRRSLLELGGRRPDAHAGRCADPVAGGDTPLVLGQATAAARGTTRPSRRSRRRSREPALLRDLTVRLDPGELVALVGRNGSGKTTLLACLAGLRPLLSGTLTGPRAGLVFQNPEHQFTQTTVRAEVATGLPAGREHQVDAALARFGLTGLAGHNPFQLSGGQKRRLSLAAMLVHDRPYLLADEPGYGLDRHATIAVMRALAGTANAGRGVLFSSHDLRTLCAYARRVLVLDGGRLLADTTPLALLRDDSLLEAAGLRAPRLLAWLRDEVADDARLAEVLRGLDDLTLPVGDGPLPAPAVLG